MSLAVLLTTVVHALVYAGILLDLYFAASAWRSIRVLLLFTAEQICA